MNSPLQSTNNENTTHEVSKNNLINSTKYNLYQCKNERIYTLVNKVSGQIDYVMWQKSQTDKVHIFNDFEAGSIKAMWNSKNRNEIFIRDLSLQKPSTQQLLSQRLKEHRRKTRQKNRESYKPLNENISDGIYIYTNTKDEEIYVGILSWRITNIHSTQIKITPAQKAAITKSIKNYSIQKENQRLKKHLNTEEFDDVIPQENVDLNSPKIDHEIIHLLSQIWDTSHWVSQQQISLSLQIYKYFSSYTHLTIDEQYHYLQDNQNIWLLFSWIVGKMKNENIKNYIFHIKRLEVVMKIIMQWNKEKTQN